MTQTHDAGPEIDGESLELETVADDTSDLDEHAEDEIQYSSDDDFADDDDEHPFTAANYEAAAEQLAAEADLDGDEDRGDAEPEPSVLDGLDPKLAAYVQKLRRGEAEKRVALASAEEQLQTAGTEIAALQARQQDRLRADVERIALAERMFAPGELWLVADLAEVLDKHGEIDAAKVAKVIEAKVPTHWRVPVKGLGRHGFTSGATGMADIRPTSWSEAVRGQQG
jgi:hypothetical protein